MQLIYIFAGALVHFRGEQRGDAQKNSLLFDVLILCRNLRHFHDKIFVASLNYLSYIYISPRNGQ